MPIDDINYLYENSVKDGYMFFIDSGRRDRRFYPDPSEYVITFEEPLKLVYGLDILDASIPNTMYNVDSGNCGVILMQLKSNKDDSANRAAFNARLLTLVAEQQSNVYFRDLFNSKTSFQAYVVDRDDYRSHPEIQEFLEDPDIDTTFIPPTTLESFFILVTRFSGVPLTRLLDLPVQLQEEYLVSDDFIAFTPFLTASTQETFLIPASHALADLLRSERVDAIHLTIAGGQYSVVVSTNIKVDTLHGGAGYALSRVLAGTPVLKFDLLNQVAFEIEVGQYDINTLQEEMQSFTGPLGINMVGTDRQESTDLVKQGRAMFTAEKTPFLLNMDHSTIATNIGFDTLAVEGGIPTTEYVKGTFNDNFRIFASGYNAKADRFQIRAPGNVNLLGMRYITLRCKEIEDHLSSSFKFNSMSTGIGVFKLQDVRDITNLRFDFSTFLRKPFHPIGKLSRLTLRFETPTGTKYDFKGFNHHIMISIKVLVPNLKDRLRFESTLNPNYDPDYIRYVTNLSHQARLDEERLSIDSDSQLDSGSDSDEDSNEDSNEDSDEDSGSNSDGDSRLPVRS
jgi:hypothetical protein